NIVQEVEEDVEILHKLGFGSCRLSIAIPKTVNYNSVRDLDGLKIATTYPNLLNKFLSKNHVSADIHTISGSVEIAPGIGLADAICDLVSSGNTLFTNGLKEVEVILKSEAAIVVNNHLEEEKKRILNNLLLR